MACDLRCPECQDNLGKTTENSVDAHCGNCGHSFFNPDGYVSCEEEYEELKKKYPGRRIPRPE